MTNKFVLIQITRGVATNAGLLTIEEICKKSQGCFGKDLLFKDGYFYGQVLDRWYHTINDGVYKHHERTNEEMINICSEVEGYKPLIYNGGVLGVKSNGEKTVFGVFESIPKTEVYKWEGIWYSGGHVSQSHWDTSQEDRKIFTLISDGFCVKDETRRGNTGGYYPCVSFWKND